MAIPLSGSLTLQGSQPILQGGTPAVPKNFIGPVLQPAGTVNQIQPAVPTPRLQPAATAPQIQPAANINHVQPAASAQTVQPAVGGAPKITPPQAPATPDPLANASFGFLDGSTFDRQGVQTQAPTSQGFTFQNGTGFNSSGQYMPGPVSTPSSPQVLGATESLPPLPQVTTPTTPQITPLPTIDESRRRELEQTVEGYYQMSPEEEATQQDYLNQLASRNAGIAEQRGIAKPMEMIRGATQNILENSALQEQTLLQRANLAQAKKQAALDASKFALGREDERLQREYDLQQEQRDRQFKESQPIEVGNSLVRLNPSTGQYEVIYQAPPDQANPSYSLGFDPITGQPYVLNARTGQLEGGGTNLGTGSAGSGTNYGAGLSFNTGATGMRTDRHNNPTAFTTDLANQAGLIEGVDYEAGDPFGNGQYRTARLLGDPIATTIKVIDKVGFYTKSGQPRWTYINDIPDAKNWSNLTYDQKARVVAQMYQHEGGNGSLVQGKGGLGNDTIGQLAQQVQQNPTLLSQLPEAQQKAVIARLAQTGQQIPTQQSAEAKAKQQSISVLQSVVTSIEQLGNQIGWSGVGGLFKGSISQWLSQNFGTGSQQEQMLRSSIGQLQAIIAKERGGTSFTPNEQALLEQYTPTINDSPEMIMAKIAVLKQYFQTNQSAYGGSSGSAPAGSNNDPLGLGI